MIVHALAVDYDGTIADHGQVAPATFAALARVRESGRKVLLVTGRMLPDLRHVCPEVDDTFDAVVAENGAMLYVPSRREITGLGDGPEQALVAALRRREIPFDLGSAIVATDEIYAEAALAAIRETGVERTLVFNKGALMLLPGGVTKGTGLLAALAMMELSPHNAVAIGDAENDHAFLSVAECAVAVADAIPALRERADYVTRGGAGVGVVEFIDEHVLRDLIQIVPRLGRHALTVGRTAEGAPVQVAAHTTRLLVVGPSGSGKSTLTGVLVERLLQTQRSVCLIDPEGDYQTLGELDRVVVLGGKADKTVPAPDELQQLLRKPGHGLVLNLSAMSRAEKVAYGTQALAAVASVRSSNGLPHWLVIDEAHHLFPADGSAAAEVLPAGNESVCLITLGPRDLAPVARQTVNAVAATDLESFRDALATLREDGVAMENVPSVPAGPLARGQAVMAWLGRLPRATRFEVAKRTVLHRRHIKKYAEGELPPDRSFYFRGADDALKLRAANLTRFCELADGVDERTWRHHLGRGDYSRWLREHIKDTELADEVQQVEAMAARPASETRPAVLDAIRRRYTV
jgi:hydroxymethylpyrimidine pyrophosphatase-like HAD family hydrolase/GTPase SAR1 family protein